MISAAAKDKDDDTKVGDTEFTTYDAAQSWPTGTTAITNGEYSIPIYIGLPAKSYKVIGRITDKRNEGIDVVGKAFDEGLGSEKTSDAQLREPGEASRRRCGAGDGRRPRD